MDDRDYNQHFIFVDSAVEVVWVTGDDYFSWCDIAR